MASSADRIRRVLSDGAPATARPPAVPRLREVAPEPDGGRPPDGSGEATAPSGSPRAAPSLRGLDPDLRRRLEALGVALGAAAALRRRPDPRPEVAADGPPRGRLYPAASAVGDEDAPSPPGPGDRDAVSPIGVLVRGSERHTPAGTFLQRDRLIPLGAAHGRVFLRDALRHPVPLRPRERGPKACAHLHPRDAVFLDTETSGLAGGTGTVAFLVGAGWIDGDHFRVRQYFMRDYPEEGALLHALQEDIQGRPLVSFNGRSFDWPLLTTRWHLNRHRPAARAHMDLLPTARRLWGRTLHSHSLATLERHVIGLERGEDLPGYLIPHAWFDFLRTGDGTTLAHAFRHNEIDVVSMLALVARVGAILADPVGGVDAPEDRLGTAQLLVDLQEVDRARQCLEAGVEATRDGEAAPLRRMLGRLHRRHGDWTQALAHWQAIAEEDAFDAEAHEQVAKIHEHRLKDFATALWWTRRALAHAPTGSRLHAAFVHRAARLERRLARLAR